jgi:phosphomannomutase/phosphoglucomutase
MKMFGTNGIRGVTNEYLSCELSLQIGRAIGKVLGPGPIAVAMDTRISSDMIKYAVCSGLMSVGTDVLDLGMVPTPALQYYVKTNGNVTGGVMITASHNPPQFNGIKCISADGTECTSEEEQSIEDLYETEIAGSEWNSVGSIFQISDAGKKYVDSIVSKVDADSIRKAKFTVCVDCANGASVDTTPSLLRALGVRAITLNGNPQGEFPGHPSEPTEDNLTELKKAVKDLGADLGIAHDGDADRCVFITENGDYVSGDKGLALLSVAAVENNGHKGNIVTPVSTSMLVEDAVGSAGGTVLYTAVGSPKVARRMMSDGGVFGGEENGGLIFADHQFCRDGGMAVAKMLEYLSKGNTMSGLVSTLPVYHTIKEAAVCTPEIKNRITEVIAENHRNDDVDFTDGLRINYDDGWVLLRPSGTEPKYRIYSESRDYNVAKTRIEAFLKEFADVVQNLTS